MTGMTIWGNIPLEVEYIGLTLGRDDIRGRERTISQLPDPGKYNN